jgi:SPP1 family predicted phage head-tail adaptor
MTAQVTGQVTRIGDLNRRLVLEAPVEFDDGAGGVTRLYDVVTMLWAQVLPLSGARDLTADSPGGVVRYRIVVRARPDITTRHRFQDGAHIYRVIAARPSADRRFLEIDAEERED